MKTKPLLLISTALSSLVYGACTDLEGPEEYERACVLVQEPVALSEGGMGHKPKLQRAGNGTLVLVYGDSPTSAGMVFDTKSKLERQARDIFARTCKPSATSSCGLVSDWSAPVNISNSASLSSMSTAWQGGDPVDDRMPFAGDIDKPNVKIAGPSLTLSWTSKYCPDGDPSTAEIDPPVQRAVRYLELDDRVIPFSCTWTATSIDSGVTWSVAQQLSSGERDAKQDAVFNGWDKTNKIARAVITWQEDPEGLQLGEADGPGDGASGANATGGTDIWMTRAQHTILSGSAGNQFDWADPIRLTDNFEGLYGLAGQTNPIFDADGHNVAEDTIEKGRAASSRANVGLVGTNAIVAWEETKGSEGLDEGKFIRYVTFPFDQPPEQTAGCIVSDPSKNARRVRFLTQSGSDAGQGGIQLAMFWKEGVEDKGGPSDIVIRRGMGGMSPDKLVPAVDSACATSVYADAILLDNRPGENLSSQTFEATADNLADDTELNDRENALAHRGVLRGRDLWVGWSYTNDLEALWAQLTNYNFWFRHYDVDAGAWDDPVNATNIEDTMINVREPRFVGTPKSTDACANDPTECQNKEVIYIAWGTQVNEVGPFDHGGDDLGIKVMASLDGGASFGPVSDMSVAQGVLADDDEYAFESQIVVRPDGLRFFGTFAQADSVTGQAAAMFVTADASAVRVTDLTTIDDVCLDQ